MRTLSIKGLEEEEESDQPKQRTHQVQNFQNGERDQQGLPQLRARERRLQFAGMGVRRLSLEQGRGHAGKPGE